MLTKTELMQIKTALNGMKKFRMHVDYSFPINAKIVKLDTYEEGSCVPVSSILSLLEAFTDQKTEEKNEKK